MPDPNALPPTLYVIDDDHMMRDALDSLLRSLNFRVRCFNSTRDFQLHRRDPGPACLIVDVRMPDEDGLTFQRRLSTSGDLTPVIFLTGHGDVPMAVRAMRHGAVEFLLKPFKADDLVAAVRLALAPRKAVAGVMAATPDERKRFASLTSRERKIVDGIVAGRLNKQIAAELGLKEITVKVNRAQVMRKLEISNVAALMKLMSRLMTSDPGSAPI